MRQVFVLTGALLMGCAPIYKPPTEGPIAGLTFEIDSGGAPVPAVVIFQESEQCQKGDDVKLQKVAANRFRASVAIPANRDLSFMMLTIFTPECAIISTITPEQGANYIASFQLNQTEGRCYGDVYRMNGGTPKPEKSARHRKFTRPMTGSGAFCSAGDIPLGNRK